MWKEALDTTYDSRYPFFYHFVKDTGTINLFGRQVLVKYIETTDSALYGSGEWWTEEFGLIKYNDEGMNAYLIGCVIDGIAYGDTTTVDVENEEDELPKDFYLSQNYPNPFNPETTIKYSIPALTYVEIKVYDLLGKEIETLVNKEQNAGTYYVEFNGNNLASGLYLYRIKAGNFMQAKKMYLLK